MIEGEGLRVDENAGDALRLVQASLADPSLCDVDPAWAEREFLPRVPADLGLLRRDLDRRLDRDAKNRTKDLTARGKKEAASLRKVIADQEKRLAKHKAEVQKKYGDGGNQLSLDFDAKEREQLLGDIAYWDKRIAELAPQAEEEAAPIEKHYSVVSARREAVGLVYLWPVTG